MSAADGVSLPTTLAQMGSVAKTQARAQPTAAQNTPFAEQLNKDDELRVQRIKETEEAKQQKIDPKNDNPDRRQRRRLKRNRKLLTADEAVESESPDDLPADGEQLGQLLDLRV